MERCVALPLQAAFPIGGLAGKGDPNPTVEKGERPICLLSGLYQTWGLLRGHLNSAWESRAAGKWDTAIAGSAAPNVAITRAVFDEAAMENGMATLLRFGKILR